ncbi:MAG: hemerythrin [Arcobacter sp.]|nr:MAG: hemerythrin [Arcobacter sp.]
MKNIKEFENEKHLLKNDTMDTLHQEFLDIYNSVDISSYESFIQKLIQLKEHSRVHFAKEEELMDEFNYPTAREHKDEHAKVLAELNYFINNAVSSFGKKMLKAYYIEKLPDWFDLHLLSMDSDLAAYLNKSKAS